ncbi:YihY/virulence factor BrkB family protein [Georgenia sp. TF02-10]|uniref:YihY/virulence factor BrkB family protein n=1 Tax=Georgenia sp. TF02-10 TaxID=2917725 RepID=UPI001FA708B4|nr:YihY/virulence factor BrkB family protein [Georgenia sp. TF02-10]UNX54797.1 YihY/virulence factor BrkB family protein [Georgenia sp. TF02-10]
MSTHDRPHEDHPAKPDSLSEIRKPSWGYVLKKSLREFLDDQCTDIAAGLTYYAVLSLFPALIALVSILSLVGQAESTTNAIVDMLEGVVPETTMETLEPVIETLTTAPAPGIGLLIGLLTALWTASNYVNAFSRAMNRMYEIPEGRPFWKLRPVMYGLTALLLVLVAIAGVLLVVSGPIARTIGDVIGLGSTAVTVWNIAKWPVLLIVVIVIVALLYYVTPNVKQPKFRWISPGAVVAIVVAGLAVLGFGIYVSNFGSYSETYGTLAGVIIFLLLLWITNLALLYGAEFDAELERGRELQAGIAAEEKVQLPPRDTRASDKKAAKARDDVEQGRRLREQYAARRPDRDSAAAGAGDRGRR